jgi:hypothetical protein
MPSHGGFFRWRCGRPRLLMGWRHAHCCSFCSFPEPTRNQCTAQTYSLSQWRLLQSRSPLPCRCSARGYFRYTWLSATHGGRSDGEYRTESCCAIHHCHRLDLNPSTTFIPGGSGTANASASIGSFTFRIPLISTSFTSGLSQSSATSDDTVFPGGFEAITRSESATIVGGSLTVLDFNLGSLAVDPARNDTIFSAHGVTVVLNNNPFVPFPNELVDAVASRSPMPP